MSVLRGREAELALMMRLLDSLCAGSGGWLLRYTNDTLMPRIVTAAGP